MPSALPDNSHRSLLAGEAETDELQHRSRRLEEGRKVVGDMSEVCDTTRLGVNRVLLCHAGR